jgi:hypothetical protein
MVKLRISSASSRDCWWKGVILCFGGNLLTSCSDLSDGTVTCDCTVASDNVVTSNGCGGQVLLRQFVYRHFVYF